MWMFTKWWPVHWGDFNNRVDRMMSTSQPLAPITPLIAHWLMNKVARWQGWRFLHGFNNMDFCSPKPSWLQPLLRTQYIYSRDQHWDLVLFPGVISQSPHGSWITLDYFHHGKDNALFLLKQTLALDIDSLSLHIILLAKLPSEDFQNAYPPSWYVTQHCL